MSLRAVLLSAGCIAATLSGISSPHAEEMVLEEIVVTATHRAESVQDIPVSVTDWLGGVGSRRYL